MLRIYFLKNLCTNINEILTLTLNTIIFFHDLNISIVFIFRYWLEFCNYYNILYILNGLNFYYFLYLFNSSFLLRLLCRFAIILKSVPTVSNIL